jgi:hypothetical protein
VTGIIAAGFNNFQGVGGLAPNVKVLPLKVLDANRNGYFGPISDAIRDAANSQAQVINMSLVGYQYSVTLHDAVNYAVSRGVLVVAAGGNCAQGGSVCGGQINPTAYPAAFPGVLAVAASDRFDRPATYSGYKSYIGIAAPGGTTERGVWSTTRFGYGYMHGTSMSAPMVSAAAALVWTLRPASTPDEIAQALKSSADKTGTDPYSGEPLPYGSGRNDYFGSGRLNAAAAVRQVHPPSLAGPGWQNLLAGGTQRVLERKVTVSNPSGQGVWWQATVLEGASWLGVSPSNGTAVFGAPGELILAADARTLAPGSYFGRVQLTALAPAGMTPVDIPVQLTVAADLTRAFAPIAGRDFGRIWYDPDAADNLYRFEPNVTNDGLAQVVLPFPVSFYGAAFPAITISENGFVLFGQGNAPAQAPSICPGNGAAPNNALYVLATDWVVDAGAGVIVHHPNADTFAVTWRNARLSGSEARGTFQLVITRDGEFRANYRDLEDVAGAVIGSENDDGTVAENIFCQGRGLTPPATGTLSFNPRAPWQ